MPSWLLYGTCIGTFVALVAFSVLAKFSLLRFLLIFPAAAICTFIGSSTSDNMPTMLFLAAFYGIVVFSPTLAYGKVRTRWIVGTIAFLAALHMAWGIYFLATFDMPAPG